MASEQKYRAAVEEGFAFDGNFKGDKTWDAVVYFGDHLIVRCGSYFQRGARSKKAAQLKANAAKSRYQSHYDRTGKRWEVEQAEIRAQQAIERKTKAEAERKLRAAAPDMLAALERVQFALEGSVGKDFAALIPDTAEAVRTAIAKAREGV